MKKSIFIIMLTFLTVSIGCVVDKYDSRLKLVNNSDFNLFTFSDFSDIKDTLINCENCFSQEKDWIELYPKDTLLIGLHGKHYDKYLENNPDKIFRVFVFSSDTIKKYGWEKSKNRGVFLKRYDITLKYIKENNWIINYPPRLARLAQE